MLVLSSRLTRRPVRSIEFGRNEFDHLYALSRYGEQSPDDSLNWVCVFGSDAAELLYDVTNDPLANTQVIYHHSFTSYSAQSV
jgi:hypothetical protein